MGFALVSMRLREKVFFEEKSLIVSFSVVNID